MNEWRPYEPCRENEFHAIEHRDPQRWAAIKLAIKWGVLCLPLALPLVLLGAARREAQELHAINGDWRP